MSCPGAELVPLHRGHLPQRSGDVGPTNGPAQTGYRKADNCFLELADPAAAQKLADEQLRLDWPAHLNRLLALAHPVHQQRLVPLFCLQYYWTSTQSEYATDLLFKDPEQLAKLYPCFVHHGIMTFRTPQVMRFLGHQVPLRSGQVNGHFKGGARSDRLQRHEGVCLRHGVGINGIKIYDKLAQLLRVETTLNAPEVFKVYRKDPAQPPPDDRKQPSSCPPGHPGPRTLPRTSRRSLPIFYQGQ